jgi:hypothetical protein
VRGWGRDGQRWWTLLQCPPLLPLGPPAVGKQCLRMRVGGAPCRLYHCNHNDDSRSDSFGSNRMMLKSMPPQRPSRDERMASQGGGGGRRINVIVNVSHGSIQATDGDAEPPAYHHGLLPLDPFCAFTTFLLAIKRRRGWRNNLFWLY